MENHSHILKKAGLRTTKQRLALIALLLDKGHRHFTAEMIYEEALNAKLDISLATIYNSLHHFVNHGIIRELNLNSQQGWFDTNTHSHFHYYDEQKNEVFDVPHTDTDQIKKLIAIPDGYKIKDLNVVVHLKAEPL